MAKIDTVPEQSSLARIYGSASYQDCFSQKLPSGFTKNPAVLFQDMIFPMPVWIRGLMEVRNWIVQFFGLKTNSGNVLIDKQNEEDLKVGGHIGFFEIVSLSDAEIVVTANDRHLDSSFSLFLDEKDGQTTVFLTSVVTTKEWFGDAYMFVIAPFHRLIVRSSMARLPKN